MRTSVTPHWPVWLPRAEDYLTRHLAQLERLLTHDYPILDATHAFETYRRPGPGRLKVTLTVSPNGWSRP